jgi:type IV pilus assembly protein PilN
MKIKINLASQPFRRDRPMLVASGFAAVALAGLMGLLLSLQTTQQAQVAGTQTAIAALESRLRTISAEQARIESVLRKPENAEVLERSVFLNALLYRKGISWTRIFADLEKTVPHNVRVISIRPFVNAENQITLDMTVGSESPQPVIEFIRKLESPPLFGSAYLHSSLPPTQTEPLYRYRVTVNYAQKL